MRKYCLAIWIAIVVNPVLAQTSQIYKWTDSNGNVHFSDKPHPGAQEIELPKIQTYSTPAVQNPKAPVEQAAASEQISAYEKISIVQPEDQATIRNPQGYLPILLEVNPKMQEGDAAQIIFDGTPIGKPQETTTFAIQDVKRGSHTLAAQLLDRKGNVLMTSAPITIYMMPPRVGMGRKRP